MGKNRALLIIDLQEGFNPSAKLIKGILKRAQNYSMVVATQFTNGNPLYQRVLQCPRFTKKESALIPLPEKAKVFKKTGYGLPRALIRYLKNKKITRVDIGGLETDACVLAALFDLWDAGIQPRLLRTLSSARSKKLQKAAHLISKRNFGF